MIGIEQRAICDGVNFRSIRDTKFKTMRISAHLIVPMSRQTAAENALLPFLLSRASREYPDFTKLGQRLAELYGASLNADVQKLGDLQVLSLSASGIADRYALEGEAISGELAKLLCSILFDPPLVDGLFPEDGFEQEKRQTMELIDSEYSDKRTYARQRCEAISVRMNRWRQPLRRQGGHRSGGAPRSDRGVEAPSGYRKDRIDGAGRLRPRAGLRRVPRCV